MRWLIRRGFGDIRYRSGPETFFSVLRQSPRRHATPPRLCTSVRVKRPPVSASRSAPRLTDGKGLVSPDAASRSNDRLGTRRSVMRPAAQGRPCLRGQDRREGRFTDCEVAALHTQKPAIAAVRWLHGERRTAQQATIAIRNKRPSQSE